MVNSFEVRDPLACVRAKRMLAIKSMQHDPFQQVAERQVMIFRQAFQDFEQAFFDPHAGLDSLDQYSFSASVFLFSDCHRPRPSPSFFWYDSTYVPDCFSSWRPGTLLIVRIDIVRFCYPVATAPGTDC